MKLADVSVVEPDGPPVIATVGGVVSGGTYVQLTEAGWPTLPALSVPRTENVWAPEARPLRWAGLVQAA